ncbi:amino acid ABC transporter substrate-binding protein [Clostridium tyrobutyricum]|uniref:amino acid ABC transporter substrate-binding protein n=1 Tax=Clostridium tyrobutyricum TaxID=1519 RepID=UPI001C38FEC9|nr:amino acid ABC transporter substrate-binding protein [Clostridium tyrobutyricum]MBV4431485.1 amino acid ABC transporter substrate-binding protein [Clostridium tyrobutyricum]
MKKIKTLLITFFMITVSIIMLSGCGKTGTASTNTLESVKKAGVLKIGLEDSFPPMEFRDSNNKLVGFDVDMATEIGKRLGVKTQFVSTDFNGIILALKSGKFDAIISGMNITDERKKQIDFSKPYFMSGEIMIVKNGNTTITKSDDLVGKTVGVELGTTGDTAAQNLDKKLKDKYSKGIKEIKKYDKATDVLQDLQAGRCDVVIIDEPVGRYYTSAPGKKGKYRVLSEKLVSEATGIGFKKDNKELEESVQKAVDDMQKDGTLSKLSIKWFGTDEYKK